MQGYSFISYCHPWSLTMCTGLMSSLYSNQDTCCDQIFITTPKFNKGPKLLQICLGATSTNNYLTRACFILPQLGPGMECRNQILDFPSKMGLRFTILPFLVQFCIYLIHSIDRFTEQMQFYQQDNFNTSVAGHNSYTVEHRRSGIKRG